MYLPHISNLDCRVDRPPRRLIFRALRKDGTSVETSIYLSDWDAECAKMGGNQPWHLYKQAMAIVLPEHVFEDESVIAYDDSGWTR